MNVQKHLLFKLIFTLVRIIKLSAKTNATPDINAAVCSVIITVANRYARQTLMGQKLTGHHTFSRVAVKLQ